VSGHRRWSDLRDRKRFLDAVGVDRHLGLFCLCPLIECCHNEPTDEGDNYRYPDPPSAAACPTGVHAHSGSPVSGYTQPWEPGDDSWRDDDPLAAQLGS
jgi:hypothetical protein